MPLIKPVDKTCFDGFYILTFLHLDVISCSSCETFQWMHDTTYLLSELTLQLTNQPINLYYYAYEQTEMH